MLPELRTVEELGAELFPSWPAARRRRWIYRQVEEHGLPCLKLGRSIVFETVVVAGWLATHRSGDWNPRTNGAATETATGAVKQGERIRV